MKRFFYIAAGILLAACSPKEVSIEVVNNVDFDRNEELVSAPISANQLGKLVDVDGNEVAYQVVEKAIVFQANVNANSTSIYKMLIGETPSEVAPKTTAFFLGDRRKDDFAWENDKAAYRMYGPALLPENPSSGVDLWLKHSSELSADAMYKQEESGKPYHIDYGIGVDSYKVGHAAGCGGIALVANDQIWPGGPFATWEILQEGPLQTIFRLSYDSVQINDKVLTETITITVNAGSQVNKAEVTLNGDSIDGLQVGGAIFLHEDLGNLTTGSENGTGYLAYAEEATSDKGIYGIHERMGIPVDSINLGRDYVAVILPNYSSIAEYSQTAVIINNYNVGETFTYYFGGGWNKRDFTTDEDWHIATRNTVFCLQNPLQVNIK